MAPGCRYAFQARLAFPRSILRSPVRRWYEHRAAAATDPPEPEPGGDMRVMVIVKATKESEAENNPFDVEGAAEMFEAMGKFNEELIRAGIMLAGDGLKPSKFGQRIHFDGQKRS